MACSGCHSEGLKAQPLPLEASGSQGLRLSGYGAPHGYRDMEGCKTTIAHPDGRIERLFTDGRRSVKFTNGTEKLTLRDGSVSVLFKNGDIKRTLQSGTIEYFYQEVDTWHTTMLSGVEVFSYCMLHCQCQLEFSCPGNDVAIAGDATRSACFCLHVHARVQVFYFPNGQTEAHHIDGSKEILFPEGTLRKIMAQGEEVPFDAASLSEEVLIPKPVEHGVLRHPIHQDWIINDRSHMPR